MRVKYSEDDLLPISALQHLSFCERQCALIHIEQQWAGNRLTVEGDLLHQRVHERETEGRPGLIAARGLRLHSLRLGLSGQADVVEFHASADGVPLDGRHGLWRAYPVEYKRGRPKPDRTDEVQLCAQALCLEEMLATSIGEGAIFYGQPRRRREVRLDASLRHETEQLAERLHELIASRRTPAAVYEAKCRNCSLLSLCMPTAAVRQGSVAAYIARHLKAEGGA
jgi:CRISPR-associated exonuclease Cas4